MTQPADKANSGSSAETAGLIRSVWTGFIRLVTAGGRPLADAGGVPRPARTTALRRVPQALRRVRGGGPSKPAQLVNYETHGKVFEQVSSLHGLLLNTINLYILALGGLWAFMLAGDIKPTQDMLSAAWAFSIFISIAAFLISVGIASTIVQRLEFLKKMGERFWREVEKLGGAAAKEAGIWGWQLRKQLFVWCLIPFAGAVASTFIFNLVEVGDPAPRPECERYLAEIRSTKSQVELERAVFLFDKARCGGQAAVIPTQMLPA